MSVTVPVGFKASGATAGIKPSGKPDLCLIVRDTPDEHGCAFAALFTANFVVGAPVIVGRRQREQALKGGPAPRAVLVNAGNSNAATGQQGVINAEQCMAAVAGLLGCRGAEVLMSSTGVIGRPLPVEKVLAAVSGLVRGLGRGEAADAAAAAGIMTTDLVPKTALRQVLIDGRLVSIGAIAKGSGMIAPRLDSAAGPHAPGAGHASGTMLAFITTDAAISTPDLQTALEQAARPCFEAISVDNHPSCSDTVVCLSSGRAPWQTPPAKHADQPMALLRPGTPGFAAFSAALAAVCEDLSEQIVVDGEGATRIFRVEVRGAATAAACTQIAREVVNSPLVKCAIHGQDPNWGRIVTAAGNAGVRFDPEQTSLHIGPVCVYQAGVPVTAALSDPALKAHMAGKKVHCVLTVGPADTVGAMIGCDLSKQYVVINAEYTT